MPRFLRSLFGQVVLALVVGVVVGFVWPDFAVKLKPLGDAFIKLIKMIIPVLVFCVVVHGIAGAGDLKQVGRVGVKSLIYFEVVTTIALVLGLAARLRVPARRRHERRPEGARRQRDERLRRQRQQAHRRRHGRLPDEADPDHGGRRLRHRRRAAGAAVRGAVRLRAGAARRARRSRSRTSSSTLSHVLFKIMGIIIKLAPLGVLGAIAFTVGKYGIGSLKQLGMLVVLFYARGDHLRRRACSARSCGSSGFSIFKLLRYLREELMIVFAHHVVATACCRRSCASSSAWASATRPSAW